MFLVNRNFIIKTSMKDKLTNFILDNHLFHDETQNIDYTITRAIELLEIIISNIKLKVPV